jgi:hypothetical protein
MPPWSACLPLLVRDKKARLVPSADGDGQTEIHCILPRPGETAVQRTLPPLAWESSLARMSTYLQSENVRG